MDIRNEKNVRENSPAANRPVSRGPRSHPGPGPRTFEKPKDLKGTWLKILSYCRKYHTAMIIAITASIIGTVLTVLGPDKLSELTKAITDGIAGGIDMGKVSAIGFTLIGFYICSWCLSVLQQLLMNHVTQNVSKSLRSDISRKINRLPMWYYNTTSTGDILSRVTNDVDTVAQSLSQSVGTLVHALALLVGSVVMMAITDLTMTIAAIASVLVGFICMSLIMGKSQKYFSRQQKALGKVNGQIEEIYSGQSIVRVYNAEEKAKSDFDGMNSDLRRCGFMAQCIAGLMQPLMGFIGNFGYVVVCVVGAMLTLNGNIGFEVIVAFMMYVRYFTQPLSQIAQAAQTLQSAAAAGERVFEFLETPEMEDESNKTSHLNAVNGKIDFEHVKFGYEGTNRIVIKDFSLSVKPGQKIAIVGPTGAGKTTIVNLLMRFHELNGGRIWIDGIPTCDLKREEVHSQFCMVLQDTWVFEGTVRENLIYCSENVTEEKMINACKAVGLHHFIRTLPKGYDTVLSDNTNLSQGQKQQLTIARAMIADKPILILDEATSSVDTRTELQIQKAMDELMNGRTSFVIAHRLSTIKNADLIIVLRDGDVVESGNHEQLLEKNGFYAELYNSQFEDAS